MVYQIALLTVIYFCIYSTWGLPIQGERGRWRGRGTEWRREEGIPWGTAPTSSSPKAKEIPSTNTLPGGWVWNLRRSHDGGSKRNFERIEGYLGCAYSNCKFVAKARRNAAEFVALQRIKTSSALWIAPNRRAVWTISPRLIFLIIIQEIFVIIKFRMQTLIQSFIIII